MTQRERQARLIVASLWVMLFIILVVGYLDRRVSSSAVSNSDGLCSSLCWRVARDLAGISVLLVGWRLDRVGARIVMVVGAVLLGGAYLLASQVIFVHPCRRLSASGRRDWRSHAAAGRTSGVELVRCESRTGVGLDEFGHFTGRRGDDFGGQRRDRSLRLARWLRRARDPDDRARHSDHGPDGPGAGLPPQVGGRTILPGAAAALDVPGFELAEAAHTRSFWMICAAQFFFAYVSASVADCPSHHLPDRNRIYAWIRRKDDEPCADDRRAGQAADGRS